MANRCERTWPGRFVICLQLLSWCAVGALLLHRGFITVKQEEVIKLTNTTINNDSYVQTQNQSARIGKDMIVGKPTLNDNVKIAAKSEVIEKVNKLIDSQSGNKSKVTIDVINTTDNVDTPLDEVNNSEVIKSTPLSNTTPMHVHNVRVPTSTKKQRRYDLTPSGVVMAALGIVMLVIGPSVVILRCCDSGQQDGRFDKLSDEDRAREIAARDLPPSYEDVAGRVPRYSMLFPDDDDDQETSVV